MIGYTASRYDFQGTNCTGLNKWRVWIYWYFFWHWFRVDFVALPLKAVGATASRYGFQGINNVGIIKWRIYEYTTRYELHGAIWTLCGIAPQNDWTHSDQVRVSRLKLHWNSQTRAILMNTLADMICIDAMSILSGIAPKNDWIHNEQVSVSGFNPNWNNQMTPICMKARTTRYNCLWCNVDFLLHCPSDWLDSQIEQIWVSGYIPQWNDQTTPIFTRYDLRWGNVNLMKHCLKMIGPTASRYEFQGISCIGIIKWLLPAYL